MKQAAIFLLMSVVVLQSGKFSQHNIIEEVKKGNLREVARILERDSSMLNSTDDVGYTPLHYALIRAKWEIAIYLLNKGADVNIKGTEGGTPLHCAANHENVDVIYLLIEKGAEIEARNAWGNTPLSLASERGCEKAVRAFISLGANIQTISDEGWTPLHYAYQGGHVDVQKNLIEAGASEIVKDHSGKTPGDYSIIRPLPVDVNREAFSEYEGDYNMGSAGFIPITLDAGNLMLEDFAVDEIYPVGRDEFYHSREPWRIKFYRNIGGTVDIMVIYVQRNVLVGKKVKNRNEIIEKPILGIRTRSLTREDISDETLKELFFDFKCSANAPIVTFVQENSASQTAGIMVNDIILEFNNTKLQEPGDLLRLLYDVGKNTQVGLKVLRGSNVMYLNILLNR